MYLDIDKRIIEKCKRITTYDYTSDNGLVDASDIEDLLEELISAVERLEIEKQEIISDREDNYKPISKAEQYAVSDRDFI